VWADMWNSAQGPRFGCLGYDGVCSCALVQGRPGAPRFVCSTETSVTIEWNAAPLTQRQGLAEAFDLQVPVTSP
jgi:hypothetical protein